MTTFRDVLETAIRSNEAELVRLTASVLHVSAHEVRSMAKDAQRFRALRRYIRETAVARKVARITYDPGYDITQHADALLEPFIPTSLHNPLGQEQRVATYPRRIGVTKGRAFTRRRQSTGRRSTDVTRYEDLPPAEMQDQRKLERRTLTLRRKGNFSTDYTIFGRRDTSGGAGRRYVTRRSINERRQANYGRAGRKGT